ncbi:MAG: hypothetical protein C0598_11415 [Marinilabiliales bacterium]|nr:MAG: hypothetical protein C0598_11415 [Marinilabiliales bacterium]
MKKLFFTFLIAGTGLLFLNFTTPSEDKLAKVTSDNAIEIPDNVQSILDNSCYGCHNSDSKNQKGRDKLSFDKLNDIKTYKAIGKLTDIADVVAEGEMPPKKFLKNYPDRALSAEDKETLKNWATEAANNLAGK